MDSAIATVESRRGIAAAPQRGGLGGRELGDSLTLTIAWQRCCSSVAGIVLAGTALVSAQAAERDGFRSLAEIEAALDPLEVLADHDGIKRSVDLRIRFEFNSAELADAAQRQIGAVGQALVGRRLAAYRIRIIGHTDAVGDANYNLRLSEARANAVRQRLIDDYGVAPGRLVAEGRGETELLDQISSALRPPSPGGNRCRAA